MKSIIDLDTWKRKEHFDFFKGFDEPFFGIVTEADCTEAMEQCRAGKVPFFHFYLFQALKAANQNEEFRYRIEDGVPVCYNEVHASSTIGRPDQTFAFSFIAHSASFEVFSAETARETAAVLSSSGLRQNEQTRRIDVIHFSSIPWISFSGLTHPRHFTYRDSVPKITFGRFHESGGRMMLPVAIHAHHGLMDAVHVAAFMKRFSDGLLHPDFS